MSDLNKMKSDYTDIAAEMQRMVKLSKTEDRVFSAEEQEKWDTCKTQLATLETQIGYHEDAAKAAAKRFSDTDLELHDRQAYEDGRKAAVDNPDRPLNSRERDRALVGWLTRGQSGPRDFQLAERAGLNMRHNAITLDTHRGYNRNGDPLPFPKTLAEAERQHELRCQMTPQEQQELRAQAVGTDSAGGHLVPEQLLAQLDRAMLQFGGVRANCTVLTTEGAHKVTVPTVDDTSNSGAIIAENAAATEQDVTLGEVVLEDYKIGSKMVRVSVELMQDSSISISGLLGSLLAERIARAEANLVTVGTGSSQHNGIVTAASDSSVTTASNTAVTYEELLQLKHSVDPAYRSMSSWMMNDTSYRIVKIIADSQNRPLWLPNLVSGEPSTFDGQPVIVNQDMASGSAAKAYLYGDIGKYYIREVRGLTMLQSDQRYFENLQVAFLAYIRTDGDLVNTSAVKYMTNLT